MSACVVPISCQLTQSYAPTAKTCGSFVKMSSSVELQPAPSSFKSKVWRDFGFKVFYDAQGVRNVVKEIVICRHSFSELRYTGSTTNMFFHVQRHHPSSASTKACSSTTASSPSQSKAGSSALSQLKLSGFMDGFMGKSLGINSVRAQNISKHIGVFIAHKQVKCSY